jgi:hypothetical protein
MIYQIKRMRAFGRLSLRNTERRSIVHLYFRAGKLIHIVINRGNIRTFLAELEGWTQCLLRFERGATTNDVTLNDEHEQMLDEMLMKLCQRGVVAVPQLPRVIDSKLVAARDAQQLITPWEWQILVEATRRVSFAVGHLVGPEEGLCVLQDILDDCADAFPAFSSLKIDPTGYLQVVDRTHLDRLSRENLLEGFAALITICQYFCSSIIGEGEAHRLIIRALQDVGPALINLGIFHVDNQLLSMHNP